MESVVAFRSFDEQRRHAYRLGFMAAQLTAHAGARTTRKQLRAMLKRLAQHGVITDAQLAAIEKKILAMPAAAKKRKGGL